MNPFHRLQLPITATTERITEQYSLLAQSLSASEERALLQEANDDLVLVQRDRLLHELFEIPDTNYEDAEWKKFLKAFRLLRDVLDPIQSSGDLPHLSDFNWLALLRIVIDEQIHPPTDLLTLAIEQPPFSPGCGPSPLEVHDVIFG